MCTKVWESVFFLHSTELQNMFQLALEYWYTQEVQKYMFHKCNINKTNNMLGYKTIED